MTCPKFCNWFDNKDFIILLDHIEADIDITLILLLLYIQVDEDLMCQICLQPFVSPTDTPCSHTFCQVPHLDYNTSLWILLVTLTKKIHFLNLALICILEAQTPLNHSLSIEMIFFLQNLSTNFKEKFQVFALPLCQANFLLTVILMLTSLEIL